jgi:hypothetical protein
VVECYTLFSILKNLRIHLTSIISKLLFKNCSELKKLPHQNPETTLAKTRIIHSARYAFTNQHQSSREIFSKKLTELGLFMDTDFKFNFAGVATSLEEKSKSPLITNEAKKLSQTDERTNCDDERTNEEKSNS